MSLSTCLYQHVSINLSLSTCLYQLVFINMSLSTCLYQQLHGRPTWRDRFSNLNQARSQSHIPNCASWFKKLRCWTQWKMICVCEGVVLRERASFGVRNHLVQGELVFCEAVLFVSDSLHMTPTCSWWSDYYEHIYVYSLLFWQDCTFYDVANRCIYSEHCDGCACRECHFIVRPDGVRVAINNGIYWIALNLDGRWAREAGFQPVPKQFGLARVGLTMAGSFSDPFES